MKCVVCLYVFSFFFFQAEDGIRDLVRSRGLGDVYKRQVPGKEVNLKFGNEPVHVRAADIEKANLKARQSMSCLLYTSDAADERSSVDLGGRRIIKKKKKVYISSSGLIVKQKTIINSEYDE